MTAAPIDLDSPGFTAMVEQATEDLWRAGDLCSWKLDPHQLETHELFTRWNEWRATPEYADFVIAQGADLDDVWVEEIGRRFGKTAKWIVVLTEIALKRARSILLYGTAFQKDIAEIIVPLSELLLSDGPADIRPIYKTASKGQNEGLYFPNGSVIRLAGLDEHPNAFRGRFLDGVVLSEAGYMRRLDYLIRSVLLPQFQRRPWAFLVCESSTSLELDHDFLQKITPDAKLRGAYVKRTIEDNVVIDVKEKEKAIRQAGGRGSPNCERELFCNPVRDPEQHVIPEFSEALHVQPCELPSYFYALTGADPGFTDLFGQVWGYWDFDRARLVINHSWCKRNASTLQIAAVNAAVEFMLYGRQVPVHMKDVPLRMTGTKHGWLDLLRGSPYEHLALRLHASANDEKRQPESWQISHPSKLSTYWDGERFKQNPNRRVSDIAHTLMADMSIEHGLLFYPTKKDDKEAQTNLVRNALARGGLVFTPDAGPVKDHVQHAMWNDKRTDWRRHQTHGHYDCLSALIYAYRNVAQIKNLRPYPPNFRDINDHRVATMYIPPVQRDEIRPLVEAFGGMREWR